MAEFKIGKPVVALKSFSLQYSTGRVVKQIIEGDEFTLIGMRAGICKCAPVILDLGFKDQALSAVECDNCGAKSERTTIWWFDSHDFAPLEEIGDIMLALQVEEPELASV